MIPKTRILMKMIDIIRMFTRASLFFLLIVWLAVTGTFAQEIDSLYSVEDTIAINVDLFSEEDPASITLVYDIKDFLKNKNKDEYVEAQLIYHFNDTVNIEKEIRIKARGKSRQEICSFPPLWINIKKANVGNRYLEDIKKIKLVTHCAGSKVNMNYVLKEFLIYKMYNIISQYSFRVRLVKMRYIDTGRKNKEYETWGFLIEPENMMAERLDGFPLKMDNISYKQTEPHETDIMAVFQYMIGNADYSITRRHNVKLLKLSGFENPNPVPVPYDFDYTGFVNAHYAIPGEGLSISSVTERYYLGPCRTEETLRQVINQFQGQKEEIYNLVESFEYLDEKIKKAAINYLDKFFLSAGDDAYIERNLLNTCRPVEN